MNIKKTIFILVLIIFLSVVHMACSANEVYSVEADNGASLMATEYTSGYYTYTVSNSQATIKKVNTSIGGNITIPSELGGYKVVYINSGAFQNCVSITSITIPSGVTSIGNSAFKDCDGLKTVTINGTNLELEGSTVNASDGVFYGCGSLETVNMNSGVKIIGNEAFEECVNLKTLKICDSVEEIESSAFNGCVKLENVTWGRGIKTIGSSAFYGCTLLNSVTLPSSLTTISPEAFQNCVSITSITIPSGVTSIGNSAFKDCDGLKTVTINGTNLELEGSTVNASDGVFYGCGSLESLTINSGVKIIGNEAFEKCEKLTIIAMEKDVTTIAASAFGGCESITDVYYASSKNDWNNIAIGNDNDYLLNARIHYNYIVSEKKGVHIKSVNLKRNGLTFNIMNVRQTFEKNSSESVSITVDADWGDYTPGKILLSQNAGKSIQTTSYNFGTVVPGKTFATGERLYIIMVDGNGKTLETLPVYLQVVEPVVEGNLDGPVSMKLFDAFSFEIPEDKPVVGNQKFEIDIGAITGDIEIKDGTFKAVLGVGFEKDDEGKFGVKEYKGFKETIKDIRKKILEGDLALETSAELKKKGFDSFGRLKIKKGWEPELEVCGYVEGVVVDDKLVPVEGGIVVIGDAKYTYEGQALVGVVPVHYSIGAGGSITLETGIKGMVSDEGHKPLFSGILTISPQFEISGGLGVVYVGEVGARGKATLDFDIGLDHNYQKVDLTGQAFFEIKALNCTVYSREFAKGTWNIFEKGRADGALLASSVIEDIYQEIDINDIATPENRDYIAESTEWLGDKQEASLMAVDYSNKEIKVLQTNVYPDTKPLMMNCNDVKVLVWIADNASRTDINKTELVYSVYSETAGTWSTPKSVMNDGTADYYPAVKDGYVVWQNATKTFSDSVTLAELAKNTEIYISKFNGAGFDTPVRITNNTMMDTQPQIAVCDNLVAVAWTQNTDNNILGITGKNAIYIKTYENGTWSQQKLLKDNLNPIAKLTIGYVNKVPVVAYSEDKDKSLNTVEDRELYILRNGSVTTLTDNDVIDSNPVFCSMRGDETLFWFSNNNIYYVNDFDSKVINTIFADGMEKPSDNFSVISNNSNTAVLWTSTENGVSEVHGALHDGKIWSKNINFTSTGEYVRYPHGIVENDGSVIIGFNRTQNVPVDDYFENGRADLCVVEVAPSYDLSITNVIAAGEVTANQKIPLYVTIVNSGELTVDGAKVAVKDKNNIAKHTFTYDQKIVPGEIVEFEAYFSTGTSLTDDHITVTVSANGVDEYNASNNSFEVTLLSSDVAIEEVTTTEASDGYKVNVTFENIGQKPANNVVLEIRKDTENGAVVIQKNLGTIGAGTKKTVEEKLTWDMLADSKGIAVFTAVLSTPTSEASYGNNSESFAVIRDVELCTVTYNYSYNGGWSSEKTEDEVVKGSFADLTVTAKKAELTVGFDDSEPWEFVGWNTDPDATTGLSSYRVDSDVTLYAIFRRKLVVSFYVGVDENGSLTTPQLQTKVEVVKYNNEEGYAQFPTPMEIEGWTPVSWRTYYSIPPLIQTSYYEYGINEKLPIYTDKKVYSLYKREVPVNIYSNDNKFMYSTTKTQYLNSYYGEDGVTFDIPAGPAKEGNNISPNLMGTLDGQPVNQGDSVPLKDVYDFYVAFDDDDPGVTTYKVNYNYSYNGGTSSTKSSAIVTPGIDAVTGVTAYKNGWIFVGWNTDKNAHTALSSYIVNSDVTLYAIFKKDVTVTYYSYTNVYQSETKGTIYNQETSFDIVIPRITNGISNAESLGWRKDNIATAPEFLPGDTLSVSENMIFYAIYRKKLSVAYDANGGGTTPAIQYVSQFFNSALTYEKVKVILADAITRDGYNFVGWTKNGTTGTIYKPGTEIEFDSSIRMYAAWSKKADKEVIYDYSFNGGISAEKTHDYVFEDANADLSVKAVKDGWIFVGWNADKNAKTALETYKVKENVVLYAIFKKEITVSFYSGAYNSCQTTLRCTLYNRDVSGDIVVPRITNGLSEAESLGWRRDEKASAPEFLQGDTVTVEQDTVFYAIYRNKLTIYYNANGGSLTPDSQTIAHHYNTAGTKETVAVRLAEAITRDGYSFLGWTKGGTTGSIYEAGSEMKISDSAIMFANWKKINGKKVTYNYSYNGGSGATKTQDFVEIGKEADLSVEATKADWTFVGWSTTKDAFKPLDSYVVEDDVTLFAIFKKTYTANMYSAGSIEPLVYVFNIYNSVKPIALDAPFYVPDGWKIEGWRTDTKPGETIGNEYVFTNETVNFYAVYSKDVKICYELDNGQSSIIQYIKKYRNYLGAESMVNIALADAPYRNGYTFEGWSIGKVGGNLNQPQKTIMLSGDTTIFANWKKEVKIYGMSVRYGREGDGNLIGVTCQDLDEPAKVIVASYNVNFNVIKTQIEDFVIGGETEIFVKDNPDCYIMKIFIWKDGLIPAAYDIMLEP